MLGSRLKWIMKIALTLGATVLIIALAQVGGEWSGVAYAAAPLPSWCPSVPTISPCPDPTVPTFTDVPDSEWFYDWVETVACHNYVVGYGDGTYRPLNNVTRAEMAVFIERAVNGTGFTPTVPTLGSFIDVDYGTPIWYAKWVEGIYQDEVVAGCGAGTIPGVDLTYCPDDNITRAEVAVFMVRSLCLPMVPDTIP